MSDLNDPTDVSTQTPASLDVPFSPAPAADDPRRGKEVFAPTGDTFEAPAKTIVPGPLYVGIEERLPELAERPVSLRPEDMVAQAAVREPMPKSRMSRRRRWAASAQA